MCNFELSKSSELQIVLKYDNIVPVWLDYKNPGISAETKASYSYYDKEAQVHVVVCGDFSEEQKKRAAKDHKEFLETEVSEEEYYRFDISDEIVDDTSISRLERDHKLSERKLIAVADRLIEDTVRRRQGSFWTPTNVVDYAYAEIEKEFGANWREEYIVWDTSSGSGNLTRDYKFKELYSSTLVPGEHEMKIQNSINPEGIHFVYDFLDSVDIFNTPAGLKEAFEQNKKIIIFQNPPYGTASNAGTKVGDSKKAGMALTNVNLAMKKDNMGACSAGLNSQFIFKITKLKEYYNLTDINICQFSKQLLLTSSSFKKFRQYYLQHFNFQSGFLVNASCFSDVSSNWGVLFSIWRAGQNKNPFNIDIIEDVLEVEV